MSSTSPIGCEPHSKRQSSEETEMQLPICVFSRVCVSGTFSKKTDLDGWVEFCGGRRGSTEREVWPRVASTLTQNHGRARDVRGELELEAPELSEYRQGTGDETKMVKWNLIIKGLRCRDKECWLYSVGKEKSSKDFKSKVPWSDLYFRAIPLKHGGGGWIGGCQPRGQETNCQTFSIIKARDEDASKGSGKITWWQEDWVQEIFQRERWLGLGVGW